MCKYHNCHISFNCLTASVNLKNFLPIKSQETLVNVMQQKNAANYQLELCGWLLCQEDNQTIKNFKQITDFEVCRIQRKRYQSKSNGVMNSCITQSCNSYTRQSN
ncbi:unnamed protein product [Paramecium pentaurelia]|uniref:Uncharacterized protein n=1 Tax=Paramecium pentaurelia TaxID=43138 RepID=A0A8S1UCT1_9CILI|nr:unnamed protein product [Paramecium pentaurelia]